MHALHERPGHHSIPQEHLLVTDSPIEFASNVASLIGGQTSGEKLGMNARSFVKKNCNWQVNMDKLDGLLDAGEREGQGAGRHGSREAGRLGSWADWVILLYSASNLD